MATSDNVSAVRENHRFDEARLEAYLSEHLPGFVGPLGVEQFKGGQSNPTFLLTAGDGRRWVLRKKPPGKLLPSAHLVEREYRVIRSLGDTDVPVPPAHLLCEDDAVIGTSFYVMDHMDGRIFHRTDLPGAERAERAAMYDAMNATLAALHAVRYDAVGLSDFGKVGGYVSRQIERWSKQYRASATQEVGSMDRLMAWLPENTPGDDETTIAHGDFRPGNMMFHPERPEVVAVLDWELATLGHPLSDLAYFCLSYRLPAMTEELGGLAGLDLDALGIPSEEAFVRRYCERTGRGEIEGWPFWIAFSMFRLAAIAQGVYKRSLEGNASDPKAGMYGTAAVMLADAAWETVSRR